MELSETEVQSFRVELRAAYERHGRHELPWRRTADPYRILISELMLQQTQVPRVIPKYEEFLQRFPDVEALAAAELGDVLRTWQGLGYNRRAKYLWQAAGQIVKAKEKFPDTLETLTELPGVGKNTAGAVLAYAFNQPVVFIETNVRTVYFHHFFADRTGITDNELLPLIEATIDHQNPREFYWALMDYGSWLKGQGHGHGAASRSKHYVRQSKFAGSRRQLRGLILRSLSSRPHTEAELFNLAEDDRAPGVLADLVREGMIVLEPTGVRLA
jgi:A/G-specific adenine glycosylase